jgi:hypothetical protein
MTKDLPLSADMFEQVSGKLEELLGEVHTFHRFFHPGAESTCRLSPLGWSYVLDRFRLNEQQEATLSEALRRINEFGDPDKTVRTANVTASSAHEAALRIVGHFKCLVWYAVDPRGFDKWETSNLGRQCSDDPPSPICCSPDWKTLVPASWEAAAVAFSMVADHDWDLLRARIRRERAYLLDRLPKEVETRPSITKEEADAVARKPDRKNPKFKHGTAVEWAAEIETASGKSCSPTLTKSTPFWKAMMEETNRGRSKGRASRPRGGNSLAGVPAPQEDGTDQDDLSQPHSASQSWQEYEAAIQAVQASGMDSDAKQATLEKLNRGVITPEVAKGMASAFPIRQSRAKRSDP